MGKLWDDDVSRHPDNAPGQDLGFPRKMRQTLGNDQSLFSLSVSRERSKLSMLFLQCFMNIEHYGMTVQGRYSSRDFFDQP